MFGTYNPWLVLLSVLVAVYASATALSLSSRVAYGATAGMNSLWVAGGAIAMGCGIWAMHFIGMLAFSLPIPFSYDIGLTLASLAIAIAISGFALEVASATEVSPFHLGVAAIIMGSGVSAMHYLGMTAIDLVPMITYEPRLMALSVLIAILASFAALWLFFRLREGNSTKMRLARIGAAFAMGFAISGMHYTGMAASRFSARAFCVGTSKVDTGSLAIATTIVALVLLSITSGLILRDSRRQSRVNGAAGARRSVA